MYLLAWPAGRAGVPFARPDSAGFHGGIKYLIHETVEGLYFREPDEALFGRTKINVDTNATDANVRTFIPPIRFSRFYHLRHGGHARPFSAFSASRLELDRRTRTGTIARIIGSYFVWRGR